MRLDMKTLLKNKQILYTVVRHRRVVHQESDILIDTYSSYDVARDAADGYEQDMKDRGMGEMFYFNVQPSTYYDN